MSDDVYADGIGEITVTGPIVRIDLVSLSPTERDAGGNPKPVFRQRVVMPAEGFAGAFELMRKVVDGMRASAVLPPQPPQPASGVPASGQSTGPGAKSRSPNFA
jgi:hypothetical protein